MDQEGASRNTTEGDQQMSPLPPPMVSETELQEDLPPPVACPSDTFFTSLKCSVNSFQGSVMKLCSELQNSSAVSPINDRLLLLAYAKQLKSDIEEKLKEANEASDLWLLPCSQLNELCTLQYDLKGMLVQVDLYKREAQHLVSSETYGDKLFAHLLIYSSPFPTTIKQGCVVPPVEVRLLTGAKSQLQILSNVRTEIVSETPTTSLVGTSGSRKKTVKSMEGDEEPLVNSVALFNKLKFLVGTGLRPVQLRFRVSVQTIEPETGKLGQKRVIESCLSESFIAMTNTKQWVEAEGLLIRSQLFSPNESILSQTGASPLKTERKMEVEEHMKAESGCAKPRDVSSVGALHFCNCLQRHYAEATNQSPVQTERMILPSEFEFLFNRKIGKELSLSQYHSDYHQRRTENSAKVVITTTDFDQFWEWFGVVLQKIRYQKFLYQLWSTGLIYGFIGKEQAEDLLASSEIGTFLLRWSERSAGSLAVAYKQSNCGVRHYLIQGKDTIGQGRSLPQFVRETSSLVRFLQLRVVPGSLLRVRSCVVDKEKALNKIGTKRKMGKKEEEEKLYYDTEIANLVTGLRL